MGTINMIRENETIPQYHKTIQLQLVLIDCKLVLIQVNTLVL